MSQTRRTSSYSPTHRVETPAPGAPGTPMVTMSNPSSSVHEVTWVPGNVSSNLANISGLRVGVVAGAGDDVVARAVVGDVVAQPVGDEVRALPGVDLEDLTHLHLTLDH